MQESKKFESARKRFQPKHIKVLFVAEAPPAFDSKRFFYFVLVTRGDTLFLEMMKTLYPREFVNTPETRRRKKEFLERFQGDGFYLIDACENPLPKNASKSYKKRAIRQDLDSLKEKLEKLGDSDTKIVLISRPVYDICSSALKDFAVVNDEMIDFPASGRQLQFREKLSRLLRTTSSSQDSSMSNAGARLFVRRPINRPLIAADA